MSQNCPACGHPKHYGRDFCNVFAPDDGQMSPCNCTDAQAMKADSGKPRFDLIPPEAMLELAEIYEYGTRKYEEESWRKVPLKKYEAALGRHLNAWKRGEKNDAESGKRHLAHALWNMVALMELTRGGKA